MRAFIEGTIKLYEKNSFPDKDTNEEVTYFTYWIQGEEGTLQINSKQDFTEYHDEPAVIAVTLKPDYTNKKLFRVSIIDVKSQK